MADANAFFDWIGTTLSGFRFIARDTARSDDVNDALDYVSAGFTAVETKTDAAIKLPDGETAATLGNAVARAGKVLGFNAATGAVEATITADEISNAQTYATNAAASEAAAAASYDSFDDRYLGAKAVEPGVDNDGNALLLGALYFNSVAGEMRVYDGAAWLSPTSLDATLTAIANESIGAFSHRNKIINGAFGVAQRGTSFTSATTPANSNDIVDVTQETTTIPTNGQFAIALDVETINKKFGIAQIIERKDCVGLIGGNVTLSFKAKVSATTKLDNVKAAIVAWSGTADTVTSDIVSAWEIEGTDPTLIANATYENTPANLSVTTSYATYTVTAAVDTASAANIIVFIWSDVTDTTLGDFLYITDVQLEPGSVATPFEHRPYGTELALCQRYYYRASAAALGDKFGAGMATTTVNASAMVMFKQPMRIPPTALETSGTATDYDIFVSAPTVCSAVPTFNSATKDSAAVTCAVASGLTAGNGAYLRGQNASAYLAWSAEL
ncbi:MAG: hypothetical protein WC655_28310 [Candidatus Hydrogenedentales bacterium]|jgi:hypothetical protein